MSLVVPLDGLDCVTAFERLSHLPYCLFLDSALRHPRLGRYSFVSVDPYRVITSRPRDRAALHEVDQALQACPTDHINELPPFQGGVAGLCGYELGQCLESLPTTRWNEFQLPALLLGLYDLVLAFDHDRQRAWLVSQGFPAGGQLERKKRANRRADWLQRQLERGSASPEGDSSLLAADALAPQHAVGTPPLTSNFTADAFRRTVERGIEYIRAGDIFQVNLAQRLLHPARCESAELYLRLRERNPATFAAYLDAGKFQILSASPERLLRVCEGHVETRPIKGTRSRNQQPEADLFAGDDLLASGKDRAENIMIVDLLRNDLSRVCQDDSVCVTQLCELERYQYVQHLVSAVEGDLQAGRTAWDALLAVFPGGSITGAPKIRAMEIIAELEPTARGAYCGALGYIGFSGQSDWNILIRTLTAAQGWWQIPVGGGITLQSDPADEYQETWHKARGMLKALNR